MDEWIDKLTAERTNKQTNVLFSYEAVSLVLFITIK